jgi:hypothetical protein
VLWSPLEVNTTPAQPVVLSLVALGASGILGAEVVLSYDMTLLEVADVGPGTLLTLDGAVLNIERNLEPGRVRVRVTRPSPTSGSGAVVALTARARQVGAATLGVESIVLHTEAGPVQPALPAPARLTVRP